ncbi:LCP family protein [Spirillospora sp. CA-253888]
MRAFLRRPLGRLSIGLALALVAVSLSAYGYYWRLQGSIEQQDTDRLLGGDRPKKLNGALNILLLGSDTRKGANAKYGHSLRDKPPASDTMILLHLSPGGGQALAISFPRDLLVPIPECTRPGGGTVPATAQAMLNEAIARGGPACTIETIERVSRIRIDHFVQVDFVGFKNITTAVGGVPICLPKDVDDPDSGFRMSRGPHRVQGEDALAYVRIRKGLGDNSDTQRIKRQQRFLGALAKEAMSAGVLTDPAKMNALLTSSAKSLTTDKRFNVGAMLKVANGMRDLTAGKLRFVTVPSGPYALDKDRVALVQPDAADFFTAVRNDRTVPEPVKPPPTPVKVRVFNGSGVADRAARVAEQLRAQGFTVTGVGNYKRTVPATQIRHAAADRPLAGQLAAKLAKAAVLPRARAVPGVLDLVIGADYAGLRTSVGIPRQRDEHRASDAVCDDAG